MDGSGRLTLRNRRFLKKIFVEKNKFSVAPVPLPIQSVYNRNVNNKQVYINDIPERPRRLHTDRLFYDANSGMYIPRNPGY